MDDSAARVIRKLLTKDPAERLTAHAALTSSFFKGIDNTTKMANSSAALGEAVRAIAGAPPRPLPFQRTASAVRHWATRRSASRGVATV